MIIVSNHLFSVTNVEFPENIVVRVNLAWMKSAEEARRVLKKVKHDVYLDYPQGRSKPPKPKLSLKQALDIANEFKQIRFFAVSNVEEADEVKKLRARIPTHIEFVPKIETERGVQNIPAIVKAGRVKFAMLDKEDLYTDVAQNQRKYESLTALARTKAKGAGVELLELQGVVFA